MTATESVAAARITRDEAFGKLESLDLSMIRMKLSDPHEGQGWDEVKLDAFEVEYRRFLALNLMYPDESIVPCEDVDHFWHAHILDTAAYRIDCDAVFGEFFDHFPYFGMRGEDDAAELETAYDRTLDLYVTNFGEPPPGVWTVEQTMGCKRKNCKPQRCRAGAAA